MYTERCGTCIHARICRRPKHAVRTWLAIFRMNILCYGSVGFIVTRWHRAGLEVQLCQEEMPTFVNSFFAILCYHVLSTLWLHDTAGPTHASTAWISLRTPPSTCSTRSCSWLWKSRAPSALSDWCAVGGGQDEELHCGRLLCLCTSSLCNKASNSVFKDGCQEKCWLLESPNHRP